jgi:hypothetical protein
LIVIHQLFKINKMKTLQYLLLVVVLTIAATACTDLDNQGSSTPIDSTNLNGTAPATYGPASVDTVYPRYEGQNDDGLRANTASSEDSMAGRHK